MNSQDHVSYETAKLLKAAGYPQNGVYRKHYDQYGELQSSKFDCPKIDEAVVAPHLWGAMKWLREEKRLMVIIETEIEGFYMSLKDLNDNCYVSGFPALDGFENTYEAACDAGIAAACRWLLDKNRSEKG